MIYINILFACKGNVEDTGFLGKEPSSETSSEPSAEVTVDIEEVNGCYGTDFEGHLLCDSWMYNLSNAKSAVLTENENSIRLDIEKTELETDATGSYIIVYTSGVPSYTVIFDQDEIDALNNRPNAATDFQSGTTTAVAGQTYDFGTDIGYKSNNDCENGGFGWWPPGPVCPTDQQKIVLFPFEPEPAVTGEECETGLGSLGLFVNGVSVYNWSDGASYNNSGIWMNVAAQYEAYDLGPCKGHAANGDYHHHDLSTCLKDQLNDDGSEHSPIYGFAADGYPIYGPYTDANTLAQSCWVTRDYTDSNDIYGCDGDGKRTCIMVDPFEPSLGTIVADSNGPSITEYVTSMSGNRFVATSGFYIQDYYYDSNCTDLGGLDAFNGHDHDNLGYHYHITLEFPYFTGPKLRGKVPNNSQTMCDGVSGTPGGGGPGGGGPGGGPPPSRW